MDDETGFMNPLKLQFWEIFVQLPIYVQLKGFNFLYFIF